MAINRDQWPNSRQQPALTKSKLPLTWKNDFPHCSTMAKTIDRTKNLIPEA
jgi:hypothetical protein